MMENMTKEKKIVSVTSTLTAVNGVLHIICAMKILYWGIQLDYDLLPADPDYYFKNRISPAIYLIVIGVFMFVTSFLSVLAHIREGQKTYAFVKMYWVCTILSMIFNFACGVFLMIWIVFNSRLMSTNNILFIDQPDQYQTMYITQCLDAGYTLVVGFICYLVLFYYDSVLLAKSRLSSQVPVEPTRRTSELPKLYMNS